MTKNFSRNFSLKLALNNIKNNRKFYLPYFLASVGIIAMFYIIVFFAVSEEIQVMSTALSMIMGFGSVVMGIFSVIFLFYTNSFLMKRRKKEIGLYNILGMEKKHIGKILTIENFLVSVTSMLAGILCGILFSKLTHLMIAKAFGGAAPFGMSVSAKDILITAALFGGLFVLTTASNLMSIRLAKPIELLYGGSVGEKEPKTKWLLAIIGAICLGTGYYIAITTESPLTAIFMFFVAVVLVIVGTYCLFTAGSVAILKALRRNKKFYYKPGNFTAVSGMIYRMKQNAVGLANICILSTMVLVMVSGTVSLYAGMNDIIDRLAPGDTSISIEAEDAHYEVEKVTAVAQKVAKEENIEITGIKNYKYMTFSGASKGDGKFRFINPNDVPLEEAYLFAVFSESDFNRIVGTDFKLSDGQAAVYAKGEKMPEDFSVGENNFHVEKTLRKVAGVENMDAMMMNSYYIVVNDSEFEQLYAQKKEFYGADSNMKYQIAIFTNGEDQKKIDYTYSVMNELNKREDLNQQFMSFASRPEMYQSLGGLIGAFLFLGIFLGIVFTFAAALIIYYKQISEGYYDKDKFEIMQKVGMSKQEVRHAIRKQVLMVFFIPLIMAGIHVLAAFKLITRLLLVFSMTNVPLFAFCTVITFLVFAVIYALVYMVTAREYYKIVG